MIFIKKTLECLKKLNRLIGTVIIYSATTSFSLFMIILIFYKDIILTYSLSEIIDNIKIIYGITVAYYSIFGTFFFLNKDKI